MLVRPAGAVKARSLRPVVDTPEFERWRADAGEAFGTAHAMLDAQRFNWACFLSEQTAQLALKALLHGIGQGGHGHDLDGLGKRAESAGLVVEEPERSALLHLARHYQPTRYADAHVGGPAFAHYDRTDAEQALADARLILDLVDRAWLALAD